MRLGAPSVSKTLRWQCSRHALLPLAVRCMHIPPAFTLQAAWGPRLGFKLCTMTSIPCLF